MKNRPVMDLVILIWSGTIAAWLLLSTVTVLLNKLFHPENDVSGASEIIANVIMAMVGFIGGRAVGKLEGNGHENKQTGT